MQQLNGLTNVSAAIVTYNNEDIILNTLNSIILNTKKVNLKLFVIDNCSTDKTIEVVKTNFPQVEVINSEKNNGFGHGHNMVLPYLSSEYHFVINPDILLKDDSISFIVEKLENDSSVIMATSKILNDDGSEQFLPKKNPKFSYLLGGRLEKYGSFFAKLRSEYTMKNHSYKMPFEIEFCTGCFFGIRTDAYKILNGFDERFFMYFEDADLTRRAKKIGKVVFYPDVEVTHLWERASTKSYKFFLIQIKSMFKYFFKWALKKYA